MNNPNPFVPKGSLLEQQNKRRSHLKLGVYCVLAVSVAGLMAMLIQGCKQKAPADDTSMPSVDTNAVPVADTNTPSTDFSNQPPVTPSSNTVSAPIQNTQPPSPVVNTPPVPQQVQPLPPAAPEAGGSDYVVVKGDSFARIAKKTGVSVKALEAANPTVKPTKLKVNEKLVIPAGGSTVASATAAPGATDVADTGASESYTVKSGDTLTKIAKAHHVKVKALEAANGLSTTKIKVGEKLKIPARAESATTSGNATQAAPPVETAPAPTAPVEPAPAVPIPSPSAAPAQH